MEAGTSPSSPGPGVGVEPWRKLVLVLVVAGSAGVAAELGLLGHYEDWPQRIPLVALGAGAVACAWTVGRPSPLSLYVLRALMAAFAGAGVLGVYFHLRSNFEFEVEMLQETQPAGAADPSIFNLELVAESLRGALPALAPLAMLQLGLLGLLAGWRHPVFLEPRHNATKDDSRDSDS